MRMNVPVKPLFDYPIDAILAELPGESDPLWDVFALRQQRFDVHQSTRSIVFNWAVSAPAGSYAVMTADYAPHRLATVVRGFGERIARHCSGTVASLMLTELRAGDAIPQHRDHGAFLEQTHRCHLPLRTNPDVAFLIDDTPHHLRAGTVYELDNMRSHAVRNGGSTPRVHLICNVLP